jgi:hypothetical protein
VAPSTPGRLQVTVAARDANCAPNNQLQSLHFARTDNATVDVGSRQGASGDFTVAVEPGTGQLTFFINRVVTGLASTVHFTVTDGCGVWPTFVGDGPSAF